MKILVLTKYTRLGSSSRLRFLQYLPHLQAAGFETEVWPLFDDEYIQRLYQGKPPEVTRLLRNYWRRYLICRRAGVFDLVWIESELFPWVPYWMEEIAGSQFKKTVMEYDDAVFHKYDRSASILAQALLGEKIDRIMRNASLVIAGNKYLAQRATMATAQRVEILPTVVNLERYPVLSRETGQRFTIGWIGSPSTAKYLYDIQDPLRTLCADGSCRLITIGSGPLNMPGVAIEIREWSEENEATLMSVFDVGIMPLPRNPWAEGKCGYKLIQYMACGIPIVASPVGVNREIVTADIGLLAESPENWVNGIRTLQNNGELRQSMGRTGRQRAEKEYSLQITAPRLVGWLRDLSS
jgi:glycosyltransferase involved in cell wall biosynthesis